MALSTVKKAFTAKPSYAGDPNCDFLAEACRKATAKNAYQPDANLKTLVRDYAPVSYTHLTLPTILLV